MDTDVLPSLLNGEIVEDEFLKIDEIKPSKENLSDQEKLDIVMQHGKKEKLEEYFSILAAGLQNSKGFPLEGWVLGICL